MNKIGMVLGVVAVATLAGCRDAEYDRKHGTAQNDVKNVPAKAAPVSKPAPVATTPTPAPVVTTVRKCTCPPGTTHTSPCACGADDCKCVVVAKPVQQTVPETVTYVVQNGDYLAKISKNHNVTIAAIKKLNPKIKGDNIWVGQKLKLPAGASDSMSRALEVPAASKKTVSPKATISKAAKPYTGATKEYVVKNGDTLGAIAYSNGCNIRQLKQLNNLTADSLKIGQKLKVPADGKPAAAAPAKPAVDTAAPVAPAPQPEIQPAAASAASADEKTPAVSDEPVKDDATPAAAPAAAEPAAAAPAETATTDYVVQEGDDLVQVSLSFGVSVSAIRQLNNMGPTDQIKPGQVIKLPAEAQKQ